MRVPPCLLCLILPICLSLPALAQSSAFIGTWETHKTSPKARAAIAVTIVQDAESLTGTVDLADRKQDSTRLKFTESSCSANTLTFATPMDEELFHWVLALKKGAKTGVLKGSYHEMLIEEKVKKR
jgi:hypothetical protein